MGSQLKKTRLEQQVSYMCIKIVQSGKICSIKQNLDFVLLYELVWHSYWNTSPFFGYSIF